MLCPSVSYILLSCIVTVYLQFDKTKRGMSEVTPLLSVHTRPIFPPLEKGVELIRYGVRYRGSHKFLFSIGHTTIAFVLGYPHWSLNPILSRLLELPIRVLVDR